MSLSLLLISFWVVLAFVMAAIPSTDNHWRRAYILIAIGIPLLIFVIWHDGLIAGGIGLVVGALVLRWPVRYLWRWIKSKVAG